jgi:hypothetical protein
MTRHPALDRPTIAAVVRLARKYRPQLLAELGRRLHQLGFVGRPGLWSNVVKSLLDITAAFQHPASVNAPPRTKSWIVVSRCTHLQPGEVPLDQMRNKKPEAEFEEAEIRSSSSSTMVPNFQLLEVWSKIKFPVIDHIKHLVNGINTRINANLFWIVRTREIPLFRFVVQFDPEQLVVIHFFDGFLDAHAYSDFDVPH